MPSKDEIEALCERLEVCAISQENSHHPYRATVLCREAATMLRTLAEENEQNTRDETCLMCEGKKMGPGEFCIAGCRDGVVRWTAANVLRNVKPWLECPRSPDGKHQVDTSMESGPNNCFHCEQPMRAIRKLREG